MLTKRSTWLLGIVAIAALLSFACGENASTDTPEASVTPARTDTPQTTSALTVDDLRNGTYSSDASETGTVTLVDGHFEGDSTATGTGSPLSVWIGDEIGFGDLNGDGVDDAAVTLVTNTGGSGSFGQLVVVVNEGGEPSPNASASLGDRVIVEAIRIAELEIEIDLVVHGPSDPLCCPSMSVTRIYILEGSNLILLEELPG